MRTFIRPRLWKPGVIFVAGTAFAAAWMIRGRQSWDIALITEVTILIAAIAAYIRGGRNTGEDTPPGGERDERQRLVGLRSRALAGIVAMIASFIGLTVAIAIKADWGGPCLAILLVTGFSYLYGLSTFGVGEEGPAEDEEEPGGGDANSGYEARSPVTS
jgi:hypothetical protein